MSSFLPSLNPSSVYQSNARLAVIGTFADKLDECVSESLDDKNISLAGSMKAYEPFRINYKGKPILPVNAVIEDKKKRRQYMMELRRLISKAPSVKVTIKLRWFGFYLSLLSSSEAKQRAILSLSECVDIGRSLDMDEHETRKAITFFHNMNLIWHYQSLVIIELKPFLDLVSLLIGVTFINEDELQDLFGIDLPAGAREHFRQHGCFDRHTLTECFQFPRLLNANTFINLLADVKAVAIIEKSNEFFMPCVLRYASKEKEHVITADVKLMGSWIVRLMTRVGGEDLYIPLPPAFSPTLIALLLSSYFFTLVSGQQQYRNIFVLRYINGGDVTIIERQVQLEIYYSFSDSDCSVIRSIIRVLILETEMRLSFDVDSITIEDSFLCSCNPQRECRHILCKPSKSGPPTRARCELTMKRCELREQELRWLQSPADTTELKDIISHTATELPIATSDHWSTPLTVKHLVTACKRVSDWHTLGIQLDLTPSKLNNVHLTYHAHGVDRLKIEMFVVWLKSSPNASWSDLIAALRAMAAANTPVTVDMNEAMDKMGHNVEVRISNVSIHGFPATGKTSVVRLAMGQPPVLHHDSTGVAEPPKSTIIVGDDSSVNVKWEELTDEKMLDMVCKTIEDLAKPVATKPAVVQHEVEQTSDDRSLPITSTPSSLAPSHQSSSTSPSSHPPHSSSISRPSSPSNRHSLQPSSWSSPVPTTEAKHKRDFPKFLKDIMQRLPNVKGASTLFSTRLILMSDSGGQPNYLDVFPLFVRNRCLALFTLKLNERLDTIPQFSFRIKDVSINIADTMLQRSHGQLLESLAKSMSPFLPSLSPLSDWDDHTAKFTIIGTFADRVKECADESIDDKNASLAQNLKAYENLQMGKDILPINAVTENKEERDEYVRKLRERIQKAPSRKVTVKLRWFGFYLSLQKDKDILTMRECLGIGNSLDMDDLDTRKAITFFHNLNLILHYQTDSLDSVVFISLQPIFDLVSHLIGASCFKENELKKHFNIELNSVIMSKFQKCGQLDEQTLRETFQFPKPLDAVAFIDLLAEVKAVAIIENSKPRSFFMPCALNYTLKVEDEILKIMKKPSRPLIIRLKFERTPQRDCVPLPPGFSPTLIVLLLSSRSFSICNAQQYRNMFVLRRCIGKGIIIIVERRVQLEIYYSFDDSECSYIRSDVHDAILKTEKRLSFDTENITIEDSFPCSCSPPIPNSRHIPSESSSDHHKAYYERSGRLTCLAECDQINEPRQLRKKELRWLSPDTSGGIDEEDDITQDATRQHSASVAVCPTACATASNLSKPLTIDDLNDVLSVIRNLNDWMDLGLQLGLLYPTLERIDRDKQKRTKDCKRDMLVAWLRKEDKVSQSGVPSWSVLKAALNEIGEKELAAKIN